MVPTWGGSMFEALMVPLFVPEEKWGTKSWALNHPTYVQAQIEHGMDEAKYGYWGFSPSNNPRVATASTAWTRSAWSRTATRQTRSGHSSTTATATARP